MTMPWSSQPYSDDALLPNPTSWGSSSDVELPVTTSWGVVPASELTLPGTSQ